MLKIKPSYYPADDLNARCGIGKIILTARIMMNTKGEAKPMTASQFDVSIM
jgi:hypothetical protein